MGQASNSSVDAGIYGDTAWNYAAFAVMGGAGVFLNLLIANRFGIGTLGVFNQIYAIYVVTVLIAAFGLNDSAQKFTSEHFSKPSELRAICRAALIVAAITGSIGALILYFFSPAVGALVESPAVGKGLAWAAPGVLFYTLNKTLMGVLNGQRRMRAFAISKICRASFLFITCTVIVFLDFPGHILGFGFTMAEVLLAPGLFVVAVPFGNDSNAGAQTSVAVWLRRHVHFGSRGMLNGILSESYLRIDILVLAIFLSDREVGIYSFAALFVEGLHQLPVIIRHVSNPILVRLLAAAQKAELARFIRKAMVMGIGIYVPAAVVVYLGFPYLDHIFPDQVVVHSQPLLVILSLGLMVYAPFIPINFILLQAGLPGRQSLFMAAAVSANVVLNLILIPPFGLIGAAAATAISFVCSSLFLNLAIRTWLGLPFGLIFRRRLAGGSGG